MKAAEETVVRELIERKDLSRLAELWVSNAKIDWRLLHAPGAPRRVSVPTYPFAKERYWFPIPEGGTGLQSAPASNQQRYRSILTGAELLLKDHQVPADGHGLQQGLPEATYVEMALAAMEPAASVPPDVDVQWLFGTGHPSADEGAVACTVATGAAEKMELFLRQEIALQLQEPLENVTADQNYFDLGLTSLAIAYLVQKMSRLLEEDLHPSALLEYSDIRGLASYLAVTYPDQIDALSVVRPNPPRTPTLSVRSAPPAQEQATAAAFVAELSREQILAEVRWQEASLEDAYETMTF
jgi:acyl transferase domain-containing protein